MTESRSGRPAADRATVGWLSPRLWGLHVLVVAALAFTVSLGLWQFGVYTDQLDDARADYASAEVVPLQDVLGPDDPYTSFVDYQPVEFTGSYGPTETQAWVSGRAHGGYWLVAPVVVDDVEMTTADRPPAIAVVRGWSPEAGALPTTPTGPVTVTGVLQPGDARGGGFDADTRTLDGVRIPALVNVMPYDLYGGYVIATDQDPADPAALTPATIPEPTVDSAAGFRNLFYAIEWWIFGAFAVFMWWRMCQDLRRGGKAATDRVPAAKRAAREKALRKARPGEPVVEPERSSDDRTSRTPTAGR